MWPYLQTHLEMKIMTLNSQTDALVDVKSSFNSIHLLYINKVITFVITSLLILIRPQCTNKVEMNSKSSSKNQLYQVVVFFNNTLFKMGTKQF